MLMLLYLSQFCLYESDGDMYIAATGMVCFTAELTTRYAEHRRGNYFLLRNKNNAIYKATPNVSNSKNGDKILYDIDVVSINKKARSPVTSGLKTPRNDIKSQPNQNVKNKNSYG